MDKPDYSLEFVQKSAMGDEHLNMRDEAQLSQEDGERQYISMNKDSFSI